MRRLATAGRDVTDTPVFALSGRLCGFLTLARPLFFILTPVNAASASVLALGAFPSPGKSILGLVAVALASCSVNVFNDHVDRRRDAVIWPRRPIPSGMVTPAEALLVVVVSMAISLGITWIVFNALTFWILVVAVVLGGLYSACLRDRAGYLSLPPIVGLIYLGGWAAFSPETLFQSPLPWYLYLLGVVWQTAHIMIYYPLHTVEEDERSQPRGAPALFFKPSPRTATGIGIIFTCLTLLLGLLLMLLTRLGVFYPWLVGAAGVYSLYWGLRLYRNPADRRVGLRAFAGSTVFRLVISAAILLSAYLSSLHSVSRPS